MSADRRLFYRRAFLNEKSGAAIIEASVDDNSGTDRNGDRYFSVDSTIHITDCSRSISLDACIGNDIEDARDSLRKLDRLVDTIQGVRDTLARAVRREWPGKKF